MVRVNCDEEGIFVLTMIPQKRQMTMIPKSQKSAKSRTLMMWLKVRHLRAQTYYTC